jgi:hypothetical protein
VLLGQTGLSSPGITVTVVDIPFDYYAELAAMDGSLERFRLAERLEPAGNGPLYATRETLYNRGFVEATTEGVFLREMRLTPWPHRLLNKLGECRSAWQEVYARSDALAENQAYWDLASANKCPEPPGNADKQTEALWLYRCRHGGSPSAEAALQIWLAATDHAALPADLQFAVALDCYRSHATVTDLPVGSVYAHGLTDYVSVESTYPTESAIMRVDCTEGDLWLKLFPEPWPYFRDDISHVEEWCAVSQPWRPVVFLGVYLRAGWKIVVCPLVLNVLVGMIVALAVRPPGRAARAEEQRRLQE